MAFLPGHRPGVPGHPAVQGVFGNFVRQEASITWCDLFRPKFGKNAQNYHITWRPWAFKTSTFSISRDVIISGQICGSKLREVFTLGDGCWLPIYVFFLMCLLCSLYNVIAIGLLRTILSWGAQSSMSQFSLTCSSTLVELRGFLSETS